MPSYRIKRATEDQLEELRKTNYQEGACALCCLRDASVDECVATNIDCRDEYVYLEEVVNE